MAVVLGDCSTNQSSSRAGKTKANELSIFPDNFMKVYMQKVVEMEGQQNKLSRETNSLKKFSLTTKERISKSGKLAKTVIVVSVSATAILVLLGKSNYFNNKR